MTIDERFSSVREGHSSYAPHAIVAAKYTNYVDSSVFKKSDTEKQLIKQIKKDKALKKRAFTSHLKLSF